MRAELAQPGQQIVDSNTFNGLFSVHASLMIFLVIIPIFAGLANFVIPLMIGAPDMAFPRLNALSYWLLPVAGIMMTASFLVPDGGAFNTGWTAYAPLSTHAPLGQQFFTIGVQFAGTSSIMTALNFLVTIITMRAPGMTFWRMPLLVWANFTTSLLVVIATPFIAGSQFLVLLDRALHADFFQANAGGDVISYQHIFWFYSHPAVYIMMLPGFGIISEVISTKSRKPIFGYRLMALSLLAILVLGFTVWAHHMFVSGMFTWLRVPMMITTMLIAVPTGIKIFSWLATLWKGVLELSTPMLFALGFITMFTLGGISGIMLAAIPVDIHTSDTYFVVAHIHYVLFGGSIFTVFAGIYYWFPKMTGRMYDETARQAPLLADVHRLQRHLRADALARPRGHAAPRRRLRGQVRGLEPGRLDRRVLPRRRRRWCSSTTSSSAGRAGPRAPGNPWRARTLEWQVSSPPPIFNFDEIPQVVGGPYEYGTPGAVHAVMNGDRAKVAVGAGGNGHGQRQRPAATATATATARRTEGVMEDGDRPDPHGAPAHVLVVANETVGGKKLLEAIERRAARGPDPLHRRLPAEPAPQGLRDLRRERALGGPDPARPDARAPARDGHRGRRRGDGPGSVHGGQGRPPRSTAPTRSSSRRFPYARSGWLRRDLVERISSVRRSFRSST